MAKKGTVPELPKIHSIRKAKIVLDAPSEDAADAAKPRIGFHRGNR